MSPKHAQGAIEPARPYKEGTLSYWTVYGYSRRSKDYEDASCVPALVVLLAVTNQRLTMSLVTHTDMERMIYQHSEFMDRP